MKLKPTRSGTLEFMKMYNATMDDVQIFERSDPGRLYNLRCSQLPYCSASVLTKHFTAGLVGKIDMMMAYYVRVGHAVHSVMQDYLSKSGKLLANYTCEECGKKYPLSYQYECCGFPTKYDEVPISIKFKRGRVQGHIDAIFKDSQGRIWIVDFKTASIAGATSKAKSAPPGYRRQVRAYSYLLRKQYGIKVHGCMLVYIPRDNPKKPTIWEYTLKKTDPAVLKAEILADLKLHQATMTAESLEDVRPLLKHKCGGDYCDACKKPFTELLRIAKKNLNKLPIQK